MITGGSPRLRICFPLEGLNASGGVRMISALASGLAERGHGVTIVTPDYARRSSFPISHRVQIQVLHTRGRGAIARLEYLTKLCWRSAVDCDVVYATGFKTPWYVMLSKWSRRSGALAVYWLQHREALAQASTMSSNALSRALLVALAEWGCRLPLRQIAVSKWVSDGIASAGASIVPCGIDLTVFRPAQRQSGIVGRLVVGTIAGRGPTKGYEVFAEAIRHLPDEAKTRIHIVVASFEDVTLPTAVEATLLHPASDSDLVEFYRSCDAFVFTSHIEGFGLPVLEAMACGVPVVTTDCGGIREFASGTNAIVVPTGRPDLVGEAILRLERDVELRARLRAIGPETAARFSVARMIDGHEHLLLQWRSANGRAGRQAGPGEHGETGP